MDRECHYALVSQQLDCFYPSIQRQLLDHCSGYVDIFEQPLNHYPKDLHPLLDNLRDQYHRNLWRPAIERIEQHTAHSGVRIIPITSPDYPDPLRQIIGAPCLLYVRGNVENLHLPQIAVVGSRRMTRGGADNAWAWSRYLAAGGFVITSGLAHGIDGAAHRGALEGNGKTIAVMATGIDAIYPRAHLALAEQILDQGGTLITEFEPSTQPLAANFPSRNRIISGLSLGVLVVEAALRSGSLITARYAAEQDREVFAIPGSIHNPQSRGCHHLIKQGAHLVERVEEIVDEIGGALSGLANSAARGTKVQPELAFEFDSASHPALDSSTPQQSLKTDEESLLQLLGYEPVDMDKLAADGTFSVADLSRLLVSLEIKGLIESRNGVYQRLR